MRRLLWVLGALTCLAASAAVAGPNAGGVLWVHQGGYMNRSGLPQDIKPADCTSVVNQAPLSSPGSTPSVEQQTAWRVYAAFPPGSSPRLKAVAWRTQFDDPISSPYSSVYVLGGLIPDEDGAGTDFYITDLGFPTASGGQIGQSFPTGPRTALVTTLFTFWGFGYNYDEAVHPNPTWATVEHAAPGNRNFVDDAFPANEDPIMGYSTLGFGHAGTTVCPVLPPVLGACCDASTGNCTVTAQADCVFEWLGADVPCNVTTCRPPVPTERTSWGQIKNSYR